MTAIYSHATNPAIVSGTGLATDGTHLYALDSSNGQLYRLNADGSGLTPIGGARYATGPQAESIAVYEGAIYALDSGESSGITDIVSVPTSGPSTFTTLSSSPQNSLFFDPQNIAVGIGMIYVSDVNPATGQVTTIWELPVTGGNPVALVSGAPFNNISGLTFAGGALYASDAGSGTIYRIQVSGPGTYPSISVQPASQTVAEGAAATFSVSASGNAISYQWYLNGVALTNGAQTDGSVVAGASSSTLTLTATTGAESDGSYTVVVTNIAGSATSSPAVLSLTPPGAGAFSFTGVGDLPGGAYSSQVRAATDDGQIAVGSGSVLNTNPISTGDRPFLWTSTAGISELSEPVTITAGTLFITASDITPDGAVVAGRVRTSSTANLRGSAIWSNGGGTVTVIPEIAGYSGGRGAADAISSDGTVVYGWSTDSPSGKRQAYRWTAATGTVGLGFLNPSDTQSLPAARGCSSDGSMMAGTAYASDGVTTTAFAYSVGPGMSSLGYLPGGTWSAADVVTPDGSTVLGAASSTRFPGGEYFTWTQGGGMVALGVGDPGDVSNALAGISADGSVFAAGGYVHNANGFMAVDQALAAAGLDITGWSHLGIYGMNHNAKVLFGQGTNPSGNTEGWVATVASGYLQGLSLPATVTREPQNQTAIEGGKAGFGVGTSGGPGLAVQWSLGGVSLTDGLQADGCTVSGSTSPFLQLANIPLSRNGGSYTAAVHDGSGNHAASAAGILTVTPQPVVTVLLVGSPVLGGPLNLASDGTYLYAAGTNLDGVLRPEHLADRPFAVPAPALGRSGDLALSCAQSPAKRGPGRQPGTQIDPTSGSGLTQILQALAAGGGPVAAIYGQTFDPTDRLGHRAGDGRHVSLRAGFQ